MKRINDRKVRNTYHRVAALNRHLNKSVRKPASDTYADEQRTIRKYLGW